MSKSFYKDLTGQRFGRLTVLEFVPNDKSNSYWKCKCDCGNETLVAGEKLTRNHTQSCGCLQKEITSQMFRKHGYSENRLHKTWRGMKDRCYNINDKSYKYYGGRGITVCDKWKDDFYAFRDWAMTHGYDVTLTIDRIDVDGNYEPKNCRWADTKTQARNMRNNIMVIYQGKKRCLAEAAELAQIPYKTLLARYYRGDRGEKLFRPVQK